MIPLGVLAARRASVGGVILLDTFTRPDGPLRGTQADTGQTWNGGTNDRARIYSGTAGTTTNLSDNFAVVDAGVSDFTVTADLNYQGDSAYLLFRSAVGTTYQHAWLVGVNATGVRLQRKGASGQNATQEEWLSTMSPGNYSVSVTCSGSDIAVSLDGTPIITHTSATYSDQSGVGIYGYGGGASRWDNLTVTA